MKHQINECHLGDIATAAEATRLAEILTGRGYPSEYSGTTCGTTWLTGENGETIEIPDSVWFDAMAEMMADGVEKLASDSRG